MTRCMYSGCGAPQAENTVYGLCVRHEANAMKVLSRQADWRNREARSVQRYRKGTCADCGAFTELRGRDLCRACYMRHRRRGTLTQFKRAKWTT